MCAEFQQREFRLVGRYCHRFHPHDSLPKSIVDPGNTYAKATRCCADPLPGYINPFRHYPGIHMRAFPKGACPPTL